MAFTIGLSASQVASQSLLQLSLLSKRTELAFASKDSVVRAQSVLARRCANVVVASLSDKGERSKDDGDKKVQAVLVDMVRYQTSKQRVEDVAVKGSQQLTDIAEQTKVEYSKIAEEALEAFDRRGNEMLEKLDADALELEQKLARGRAADEELDRSLDELEKRIADSRNEGLFFKSLYKPVKEAAKLTPEQEEAVLSEARKIRSLSKTEASSRPRRVLYKFLVFLTSLTIIEALTSGNIQWPKLALYGAVLVALIAQLTYENMTSGKKDGADGETTKSD
eukprot:jgi/Mesen1/6727/ME000344S06004